MSQPEGAGGTITALKAAVRDKSRVNVFVDGKFRFSVDVAQVIELGLKVGASYTPTELAELEDEGLFSRVYMRALEYVLMRPRSMREMSDYFYRKSRPTRRKDGSVKEGLSQALTQRVFDRLVEKGYVDDGKFATFWAENRKLRKGVSQRKLVAELRAKGIEESVALAALGESGRGDEAELRKVVAKKAHRYADRRKLIAYLQGQGFRYDTIVQVLDEELSDEA